jgi:hypothetical protein
MAEGLLLMARRPDSMNAEKFNELHAIGTSFRYYSIAGSKEFIETKTRSECWELGDGHPVVLIEGRTGGVSIHHLVKT